MIRPPTLSCARRIERPQKRPAGSAEVIGIGIEFFPLSLRPPPQHSPSFLFSPFSCSPKTTVALIYAWIASLCDEGTCVDGTCCCDGSGGELCGGGDCCGPDCFCG